MQSMPPEGQGGFAQKVQDTAAERDKLRQTVIDGEKRCIELLEERDRLKAANAELLGVLAGLSSELARWLTTADAGLPAVIKTLGDCADLHTAQRKARVVLAKHAEPTP